MQDPLLTKYTHKRTLRNVIKDNQEPLLFIKDHVNGTQMRECVVYYTYEPGYEKMCPMPYANNKGADQPAHPRSLISAFVVRCLDSVMSLVSVTKISSLMLASVAAQAGLSLTWLETPEDTFSHDEAHFIGLFLVCCLPLTKLWTAEENMLPFSTKPNRLDNEGGLCNSRYKYILGKIN